ncbi:MAG: hypothetical protein Q7J75_05975 [Rhodoferax sp.]|nr:hypothetical protein [Rhodoferax sp.]
MEIDQKLSQEDARDSGQFKVHYHLNGGAHRMDAVVRNRAEGELLALLKEVGTVLGLPVHLETQAYGEGGLIEYLNLVFQNKEQIMFAMAILSPLLGASLFFDKIKQSKQQTALNELNLRKALLEIQEKEAAAAEREGKKSKDVKNEVLALEAPPTADEIARALLSRKKIARRRSNYYQVLLMDSKIDAVGFAPTHNKDFGEVKVLRADFSAFVIAQSDLEPLVYERIPIEIVSPVLRSGSIKWRGVFEKKVVSFDLQDQAFRSEVAGQTVQFQNGTTLICDFEVRQREDDTGDIEIAGYAVTKVHDVKSSQAPQRKRTQEQLQLPIPPEATPDAEAGS